MPYFPEGCDRLALAWEMVRGFEQHPQMFPNNNVERLKSALADCHDAEVALDSVKMLVGYSCS